MSRARADDLLVLLAVSRHRTFSAAARELGLDHTTVARRLQTLSEHVGGRLLVESPGGWELTALGQSACEAARTIEGALDGLDGASSGAGDPLLRGVVRVRAPEGFVVEVVAPALASLSSRHPDLSCEIVSETRTAPQHGTSADLDVGVTRPPSRRVIAHELASYRLGLFASESYLTSAAPVRSRADLREHTPVYYVESMLNVSDLDLIDAVFPRRRRVLGATSVHAQLALVAAGGGIGLLPAFLALRHRPELVPVLADEVSVNLTYWMTGRTANLRRPEVAAVAASIAERARRLS